MTKIRCFFFIIAILSFFSTASFATNKNAVTITLLNKTTETLIYKEAVTDIPLNRFTVIPQIILPGKTALIIAETPIGYDLFAALYFQDSVSSNNIFNIKDYRQFHTGQPVFSLGNTKYTSSIKSRKFNPVKEPQALCFVKAEVVVTENQPTTCN
jgi:hypothetical protein